MKNVLHHFILVAGMGCFIGAGPSAANPIGETTQADETIAREEIQKNPKTVIIETLQTEIRRTLQKTGASVRDLQVTVAVPRDHATPFKVSYTGLQNFKGNGTTAPDIDGTFLMEYVGHGTWEGKLSELKFSIPIGRTDNIDLPFVNDPMVLGQWESVDFIHEISDFNPNEKHWPRELYFKGLTFLERGKTTKPWLTWTMGVVMHRGDKTASRYSVKEIQGASYLFFEWKSGDVMIAGRKPQYYVLKKKL